MSLLTICQAVAREVGVAVPSSIVGSSDLTAIQLLALAQDAADETLDDFGWERFTKIHTFVAQSSASTSSYALPSDFDRFVVDTMWDQTNQWRAWKVSEQRWATLKHATVGQTALRLFFLRRGGRLQLTPVESSASKTLSYAYRVNTPVATSADTLKTFWTNDSDTSPLGQRIFKLDLKWRFLEAKGLPHASVKRRWEHYVSVKQAGEADTGRVSMVSLPIPIVNIQDGNFPSS